jgi:hypothetical protein
MAVNTLSYEEWCRKTGVSADPVYWGSAEGQELAQHGTREQYVTAEAVYMKRLERAVCRIANATK